MLTETRSAFEFQTFRVDLVERKLWSGDHPIPLTPKVFQTLAVLIENRDRLVTKQELIDTVWPDRFVTEANLTQNISVLRKALGETATGTKYIATFPGKGYRFIADVTAVGEEMTASAPAVEQPLPSVKAPPEVPRRRYWTLGLIVSALVAMVAVIAFLQRKPAATSIGGSHRLAEVAGRSYQPVLSPDGSMVAFVQQPDLRSSLRVLVARTAENSAPAAVSEIGGDAFSPAWSPDGRALAFLQAREDRLFLVIEELGHTPRVVTEVFPQRYSLAPRQLDWSPDGRLLAVSDKNGESDPFRIDLVHISDGRRAPITIPPALSDGDFAPRFSPDGTRLAFLRQSSRPVLDLLYVNMPGGEPVMVSPAKTALGDVDWSPDSRSLLFTAQSQGVWRLWRAMAGRPNPRWEPVEASEEMSQLSIARTRGTLVSSSGHPDPSIWRGKLAGDGTAVTWGRFIDSKADDIFPGFSRDGRRVVFLSTRTGARQLWVKEETGEERELTRAPQRPSYASWTTAEDLVYSDLRERRMYLFRAGSPSPAPIPLVGTVGSHTTVSPDGQTVYWVKRFYIYQAPARGGSATLLTDEGGFPLRITDDGQWIYYSRHRFSNEIWRVHTKTRRAERVSDRLRPGCWACWAANATDLVYVAAGSAREPATLERKNLATGVVRSLGELPGRLPELGAPMVALSPDGRTVLVGIGEPGQGALRVYTQLPWMAAGGRN